MDDLIMQGFVTGLFVLVGVSGLGFCIRKYYRNRHVTLKQSPSMEDLTSVNTEDPESHV